MQRLLIAFGSLFLLHSTACIKDVNIKIGDDHAIPVMNSLIASDSLIYVDLSYSNPINKASDSFEIIKSADVKLYANNSFVEQLSGAVYNGKYLYRSTAVKGVTGTSYHIEAEIPGSGAVLKGSGIIPKQARLLSGTFQRGSGPFGNTVYKILLTIEDDANEENFYQLKLYPVRDGKIIRSEPIWCTIENLKTEEGGIFDDFIETEPSVIKHFDDHAFNGQRFTFQIKSETQLQYNDMAVELSTLSKDAYLYYKSITLQKLRDDDPLFEKVPLYTNITNGIGIVGALNFNYLQLTEVE